MSPPKGTAADPTAPAAVEPIGRVLQGGRSSAPDWTSQPPDDAAPAPADWTDPAELEPFAAAQDETYLPEGFDLFEQTAEAIESLKAKHADPVLHRIRIYPVVNGKRVQSIGTYSAQGASAAWFRRTFPPGVYDIQGLNVAGIYVGGKRFTQPGAPGGFGAPSRAYGAAGPQSWDTQAGAGSGGALTDQIVSIALERLLKPAPDTSNPIADVVRAMAAQSAMMQQHLQMQMQLLTAQQNNPENRAQAQLMDLMRAQASENAKLVGTMLAARAAPQPKAAGGDLESMMRILQFGMSLKAGKSAPPADDDPKWIELVIGLAENLGPGVVAVLAQATLPADRAKFVCDVLEQHQRARAAEATAEAQTVDTEGEPVP